MSTYLSAFEKVRSLKAKYGDTWAAVSPKNTARMMIQNRFKTGLDIAKYTAAIMR